MEVVLEHEEVLRLLKEALEARGINISEKAEGHIRRNNKKGTLRVVFTEHLCSNGDVVPG